MAWEDKSERLHFFEVEGKDLFTFIAVPNKSDVFPLVKEKKVVLKKCECIKERMRDDKTQELHRLMF